MAVRTRSDADLERIRSQAGDYYSRYSLTYIRQDNDNRRVRYSIWNRPRLDITPDTPGLRYHTVRAYELGRLDQLAQEYYSDARYWWVIATANSITDPLTDMEPGQVLVIPARESVIEAITKGSKALFEA